MVKNLSDNWVSIEDGKPENDVFLFATVLEAPVPIVCVFQDGEPYQVTSTFTKKTVTHRFKPKKIIAWRYAHIISEENDHKNND